MNLQPHQLEQIGRRALEFVSANSVVGLGTGHAATAFIQALGDQVNKQGFAVRGVPTSKASEELARQLQIPLVGLDQVETIDVAVDGADEVDPECNLMKGYGGALVREKIVAASAKRLVILVGPEKLVPQLGSHGILPVEVVPFGLALCTRRLASLGCRAQPRFAAGKPYITDNGNQILDCRVQPIKKLRELDAAIREIPGVVGTGLFIGFPVTVLVQKGSEVEVMQPGAKR
ncbi:MAG TPA: ribose-5-phosphate isomerase RpiA [Pirellulales bacterium]|jgi:ribose 5-phosphate isomerase A|nr:ribose-5-phosphate isomerase RpiA [Pirellulales bacterium]HEV3340818.1 ribose-5-phosphate isomerase RpiA [Pirellulales bacterium]